MTTPRILSLEEIENLRAFSWGLPALKQLLDSHEALRAKLAALEIICKAADRHLEATLRTAKAKKESG